MVPLTPAALEKALRISRHICRMPQNAQNLHQPTCSHLLPELDAESLGILRWLDADQRIRYADRGAGDNDEQKQCEQPSIQSGKCDRSLRRTALNSLFQDR